MDPISNKKEFEDLTAKLRDLAYLYIEKYSPSKQQIKTYLLKKYLKKFQGSKVRKEITFFYRDECEKWATENIFYEAKKKGYKLVQYYVNK